VISGACVGVELGGGSEPVVVGAGEEAGLHNGVVIFEEIERGNCAIFGVPFAVVGDGFGADCRSSLWFGHFEQVLDAA
jgi:hypothetical protein